MLNGGLGSDKRATKEPSGTFLLLINCFRGAFFNRLSIPHHPFFNPPPIVVETQIQILNVQKLLLKCAKNPAEILLILWNDH